MTNILFSLAMVAAVVLIGFAIPLHAPAKVIQTIQKKLSSINPPRIAMAEPRWVDRWMGFLLFCFFLLMLIPYWITTFPIYSGNWYPYHPGAVMTSLNIRMFVTFGQLALVFFATRSALFTPRPATITVKYLILGMFGGYCVAVIAGFILHPSCNIFTAGLAALVASSSWRALATGIIAMLILGAADCSLALIGVYGYI